MLEQLADFLARSLPGMVLFLLLSAPPLAGWWLFYRLPLGQRRLARRVTIPASAETVWRLLDPRAPGGGWRFFDETARGAQRALPRVDETFRVDDAARRIVRESGDARFAATLEPKGGRTHVAAIYEKPVTGLLDHELTRLALARGLDALKDAALGRAAGSLPLFRFCGWRLALIGVVSGLLMAFLLLAPAFYLAIDRLGLSPETLLAEPAALAPVAALAAALTFLLFAVLLAVTLVHEIGHALALAAFGHRGVVVTLAPFGGAVTIGARDPADAFEAGAVALAGPALSVLAAFAVAGDAQGAPALLAGLAGPEPDYASALLAVVRAAFVLLTLLYNLPNLLPWTGSDGARTLAAIFDPGPARRVAPGLFAAALAAVFARAEDLLVFGLMFVALDGFNRKTRAAVQPARASGWRRLALAAALALIVALYAREAAFLREMNWPTAAPAG